MGDIVYCDTVISSLFLGFSPASCSWWCKLKRRLGWFGLVFWFHLFFLVDPVLALAPVVGGVNLSAGLGWFSGIHLFFLVDPVLALALVVGGVNLSADWAGFLVLSNGTPGLFCTRLR